MIQKNYLSRKCNGCGEEILFSQGLLDENYGGARIDNCGCGGSFVDTPLSSSQIKERVIRINKDFFDKYADIYVKRHTRMKQKKLYNKSFNFMLKELVGGDIKALEIGCGQGSLTLDIYKNKNIEFFNLDISQSLLDIFKSKLTEEELKRSHFICEDAFDYLNKTEELFDIICINASLHHIPDYQEVFDLMCDKVRGEGFIYLECETYKNLYDSFFLRGLTFLDRKLFRDKYENHKDISTEQDVLQKVEIILDNKEIMRILKDNSFEIKKFKLLGSYSSKMIHEFVRFFNIGYNFRLIARKGRRGRGER